jgi:hypothetical protein
MLYVSICFCFYFIQEILELVTKKRSSLLVYTAAGDDTIEDGPIAISDKNPGGASDSCSSDSVSPEVKGKLALIQRGSCNFSDKVKNAASAGAVGAIIYNNVPGSFSASVPNAEIPTVSISLKDGQELIAAIKKGDDVDLTFDKEGHVVPVTTGGTVSSFSSVGPSAELNFKPNVAGIGGTVYSTLPRYLGSWGVMSGTSMAAPYVAGSVALYRKAHGNTKAVKFINEQFQNYAAPTKVFNVSDTDSPLRQGAGLVQVYDAITEQIHTSPAEMSFNDTATTKYRKQTIVITNKGSKTASYKLYNKPSTAIDPYDVEKTGYTFIEPVSTTSDAAKLRFSKKKIRIAPGKSEKITVTVTPPDSDPKDHIMYGGFIQLKSEHEGNAKDIHVPYFGIVGVQSELPIFDEGFPTIIDKKGKEYPTNMTFVYDRSKNNTEPIPVIRLLTPTAHIKADLLDEDEDVIGKAFIGLDYMGRNFLTKSQYSNHPWDATYIPSSVPGVSIPIPVPSGTYRIRFSALKLLANPTKKESWETWTSGEIEVKN